MLIPIYNLTLALLALCVGPIALLAVLFTGRYRTGLAQRLGRPPAKLRAAIAGKQIIWLHAVSVGEVLAAARLVEELTTTLGPAWQIVISTTTATGQTLARQRFGPEAVRGPDCVFFYPFDFPWAVTAYLRLLQPRLLILMESELWPNMLHHCHLAGIPVAVVNARVSDRSYRRAKLFQRLWTHILHLPNLFLTQSSDDAKRLIALGADPAAVHTTGNLKYEALEQQQSRLSSLLRQIAADRPILVAGSTLAGEEVMLLQAWEDVRRTLPNVLLVLAPRHPERFAEVASLTRNRLTLRASELLAAQALAIPLLPAPPRLPPQADIILLDTIGDLAAVYAIATVAFVGGSLVPRGGHNPLEPARFAVSVVMGPSFENFRDIVTNLQAADAIRIIPDATALAATLIELLIDRASAQALGLRAQAVFEEQQGALPRTLAHLLPLLLPRHRHPQPCHPKPLSS